METVSGANAEYQASLSKTQRCKNCGQTFDQLHNNAKACRGKAKHEAELDLGCGCCCCCCSSDAVQTGRELCGVDLEREYDILDAVECYKHAPVPKSNPAYSFAPNWRAAFVTRKSASDARDCFPARACKFAVNVLTCFLCKPRCCPDPFMYFVTYTDDGQTECDVDPRRLRKLAAGSRAPPRDLPSFYTARFGFGEGSVGMTLSDEGGKTVVAQVVAGGSAAAAGVCAGDVVVKVQVQGQLQGQEHGTCKAATLQALCAAARPVEVTFGRSQTAITATPVAVGALEVELSKSVRRPTEA